LQHQVDGLRQLLDDTGDFFRAGRPVLAEQAVAPADHLVQAPPAVHQAHGDTIDLGLDPHILANLEPFADGVFVEQFVQARMGHRVRRGAP